jgi:membrane protein DedA with SNARE-associated domain
MVNMPFDNLFSDAVVYITQIWASAIPFIKAHQAWAPLMVATLAFCESLAILSLIVPATAILLGIGALVGASGLELMPIWLGAVIGAALGDWLSFWFGATYKETMYRIYPLSRHPEMITRGKAFFEKYGVWSVFVGRFFGPLRAIVPLIAGIFGVRLLPFQLANVSSAMVWAFVLLSPGFWLVS